MLERVTTFLHFFLLLFCTIVLGPSPGCRTLNFIARQQHGSWVLQSRRQSLYQPPLCSFWQRLINGMMPWYWVSARRLLHRPDYNKTSVCHNDLSHATFLLRLGCCLSSNAFTKFLPKIKKRHNKNLWSCAILQNLRLQYYLCIHGRINFRSIGLVSFDATVWAWGAYKHSLLVNRLLQ